MIVEAEACEFGDAELLAENARSVVVLEDPVFETGFNAAHAIRKRILRCVEEGLRTREQSFSRAQELQFIAKIVSGSWSREFGRLKFASREINEGQADRRT